MTHRLKEVIVANIYDGMPVLTWVLEKAWQHDNGYLQWTEWTEIHTYYDKEAAEESLAAWNKIDQKQKMEK